MPNPLRVSMEDIENVKRLGSLNALGMLRQIVSDTCDFALVFTLNHYAQQWLRSRRSHLNATTISKIVLVTGRRLKHVRMATYLRRRVHNDVNKHLRYLDQS